MRHTQQSSNVQALNSPAFSPTTSNEQVGSQRLAKQQSYIKALTLNPKYAYAWNRLGRSLGVREAVQVGSQRFTKGR